MREADEQVVREVVEGSTEVVRGSYDEAFVRSQQVDEVRATGISGEGRAAPALRGVSADGQPECAPTTDAGSRNQ